MTAYTMHKLGSIFYTPRTVALQGALPVGNKSAVEGVSGEITIQKSDTLQSLTSLWCFWSWGSRGQESPPTADFREFRQAEVTSNNLVFRVITPRVL